MHGAHKARRVRKAKKAILARQAPPAVGSALAGKAAASHTHSYAGSSSAGGTANSVNGFTFAAQTTDPGAGSSLATNKVLIVYA